MFCLQCLVCGEKKGEWISHWKIPKDARDGSKEFDEELRASCQKKQRALSAQAFAEKKRSEKQAFDQWYSEYIQTYEWKLKREAVLARCNWLCEGCRKQKATVVHHVTYSHVGNELLFQLVGLCRDCHDKVHGHDEAQEAP